MYAVLKTKQARGVLKFCKTESEVNECVVRQNRRYILDQCSAWNCLLKLLILMPLSSYPRFKQMIDRILDLGCKVNFLMHSNFSLERA